MPEDGDFHTNRLGFEVELLLLSRRSKSLDDIAWASSSLGRGALPQRSTFASWPKVRNILLR